MSDPFSAREERELLGGTIRKAREADVPGMVELAERRRVEYERAQPLFWRKAADSAEKQTPYLTKQIAKDEVIALVHEREGVLDGFAIGALIPAPPVYDPGGLTCIVDDFTVSDPGLWATVGRAILQAVAEEGKRRGAVQVVAVCGRHDEPKRAMLAATGYSIASEWWVGAI